MHLSPQKFPLSRRYLTISHWSYEVAACCPDPMKGGAMLAASDCPWKRKWGINVGRRRTIRRPDPTSAEQGDQQFYQRSPLTRLFDIQASCVHLKEKTSPHFAPCGGSFTLRIYDWALNPCRTGRIRKGDLPKSLSWTTGGLDNIAKSVDLRSFFSVRNARAGLFVCGKMLGSAQPSTADAVGSAARWCS